MNALPTTQSFETKPLLGRSPWKRESSLLPRLSPSTHSEFSGTVTSNSTLDGVWPGAIYGSVIDTPLTVIKPFASQQITLSPSTPITRLTRCCLLSGAVIPNADRNQSTAITTGSVGSSTFGPSQPPGSLNTTTSPRSIG